jgi:two-component system cell cycle response regulator
MARILVIEDNIDNLELMVYLFDAFGHAVEAAENGEQALRKANDMPFDLVVCDVHLPRMDGYEIVRALRAHPECCNVPIVAVTALAMVGDRERLLASGFDGYVSKPIDPKTFVREIENHLPTDRVTKISGDPGNTREH